MFWRRRARLDEEVASHIAEETADNVARGMEPAAARAAALRLFGNVEAAKETVRERNHWYWLDTFSQDVRFADRQRGWAVGSEGMIVRTEDGGATWTPHTAPVVLER